MHVKEVYKLNFINKAMKVFLLVASGLTLLHATTNLLTSYADLSDANLILG